MKTDTPQTIYLKNYTPPAFLVDTVDLDFVIETGSTTVTATLTMRRNPATLRTSHWFLMAKNWKR
jgi:aminopeptidase N